MATKAEQMAEKAARMARLRGAGATLPPPTSAVEQDDPETPAPPPPPAPEAELSTVRLSVDLAQGLYDQLDDWMRTAARASGRNRFKRVLVMRALVRELLADQALGERVRQRVDADMRRSA